MPELLTDASSLLSRLFHSLDGSDYDTLADCFTGSGTWTRRGKTLKGRAEIKQALGERAATLRTLHIAQNVLIDLASERAAAARFYLTVYRHNSTEAPPYPVPAPAAVGLCKVKLENDCGTWRISDLQTGPYLFAS